MIGDASSNDPGARIDSQLALAVAGVIAAGPAAPRLWHRCAGDGYQQDRCCSGIVSSSYGGATVRFTLPAAAIDFVQLRVPALSGTYCIDRMTVDGQPIDAVSRRVVLVVDDVADSGDDGGLSIASPDAPPLLELDVRGLLDGDLGERTLALRIRRVDAVKASLDALSASTNLQLQDALALLRGMGDSDFVRDAAQRRIQAEGQSRDERVDALLSDGVDGLRDLRAEVALHHDQQRDALAQVEARFAGGFAALHDVQAAQLSEVVALLHAAVEREGAQRQALEAMQTELAELRRSIDHVFWRRWARRLLGRPT